MYIINAETIFTLFFIMLGPIKMIIPYAQATRSFNKEELYRLSARSALLGTVILLAGSWCGHLLLVNWGIDANILLLAAGIIFFIVSIKTVVQPAIEHQPAPVSANAPAIEPMRVVFPMIITPYGLAAAIVLLTTSVDMNRTLLIMGLLLANMALNFLVMIFVRPILKSITPTGMHILSSVLGVLVVALALDMVLRSLEMLKIITPAG